MPKHPYTILRHPKKKHRYAIFETENMTVISDRQGKGFLSFNLALLQLNKINEGIQI
jgi:hypothetical protein